jgi:hypothetical protein
MADEYKKIQSKPTVCDLLFDDLLSLNVVVVFKSALILQERTQTRSHEERSGLAGVSLLAERPREFSFCIVHRDAMRWG